MCRHVAIVDNDGNGATGDEVNNGDGATGDDNDYDGNGVMGYNADVAYDNATMATARRATTLMIIASARWAMTSTIMTSMTMATTRRATK